MTSSFKNSLLLCASRLSLALGVIAMLSAPAQQAEAASRSKAEKRQSNRVKIQNSRNNSEESTAERERRLYRECQGRPNSGACAGYAYPPPGKKR